MTKARARHILVETRKECLELLERINNGEDFAAIAGRHSKCPSGKKGGDLGEFSPGMMVKEFDKVVFRVRLAMYMGRFRPSSAFIS